MLELCRAYPILWEILGDDATRNHIDIIAFFFFTFEIDPVGVELPPLLWYFLYISCSDIVSMHPVYIYLKRFDLTFLGEKYSIKTNLLGFEVANHSL